jgi:hypothetical protein
VPYDASVTGIGLIAVTAIRAAITVPIISQLSYLTKSSALNRTNSILTYPSQKSILSHDINRESIAKKWLYRSLESYKFTRQCRGNIASIQTASRYFEF